MRINSSTQHTLLNSTLKINTSDQTNSSRINAKNIFENNAVKLSISSSSLSKLDDDRNSLKNETIIQYRNEYNVFKDRKAQLRDIRNEYYSKEVEVSKQFHSPIHHIRDKYLNEDSPYFRSDLTEGERGVAYFNESSYLEYGDAAGFDRSDRIFKGIMLNSLVESAREKEFNREKVNEQFGQLLDRYNISIHENTNLTFTIDPYRFKVEVSGTDDTHLISRVQNAINTGENGQQLFYHITNSEWENNTQYSSEKSLKKSIFDDIKRETGYELDKLEVVDGKFVTEDGTDIFELTKKNIKEGITIVPKEFQSVVLDDIHEKLENLAKVGFDAVPDYILSIDYENGSFYDVGQSKNFGEGQTKWIDALEEKYSVPSKLEDEESKQLSRLEIIKEALKEISELEEDEDDKLIIDNDPATLDKDELILKYLFKTWKESDSDDLNSFLEELKKEGIFDIESLSSNNIRQSSDYIIGKMNWNDQRQTSSQALDIYV